MNIRRDYLIRPWQWSCFVRKYGQDAASQCFTGIPEKLIAQCCVWYHEYLDGRYIPPMLTGRRTNVQGLSGGCVYHCFHITDEGFTALVNLKQCGCSQMGIGISRIHRHPHRTSTEKYGYIPRTIIQDFMRHATACGHNVHLWTMKSVWDITTRLHTKRPIGIT
jgi:hypothetical protein